MARIELRNCSVILQDGFGGTAAINDTPANEDAVTEIDTVAALTNNTTIVPVGARFTVAGHSTTRVVMSVNSNEVQTVTIDATSGHFHVLFGGQTSGAISFDATAAAMQVLLAAMSSIGAGNVSVSGAAGGPYTVEFQGTLANANQATMTTDATALVGGGTTALVAVVHEGGTTWQIGFSPLFLTADLPSNDDAITFLPQQLEIKVGEGNLTYTEHNEYQYLLDRGDLDTVREGNQVPMDLKLECVFEHITTGTSEEMSPLDALKGVGAADTWVNASADPCEPYCIDIIVLHTPPCGAVQLERVTFPDFRSEQREINYKDATFAITGKCKAVEPTVVRETA